MELYRMFCAVFSHARISDILLLFFFCCSGCRSSSGWTESLLRQLDQSFLSLGTDKTCMAQIHLANRLRGMGFFFQISQTAQHWSSMLAGNSGQTRCQAGCCIRSCKVPKALIFATDIIWTTNFIYFSELSVPRKKLLNWHYVPG